MQERGIVPVGVIDGKEIIFTEITSSKEDKPLKKNTVYLGCGSHLKSVKKKTSIKEINGWYYAE